MGRHAVQKHAKDHLVRCTSCWLVFSGVEPTTEELRQYYGRYTAQSHITLVTVKRYEELLDRFEDYRRTNRIIDVGCGAGHFLEQAVARGWDVFGTEFEGKAAEMSRLRGVRVITGPLDSSNYPPGAFDVACSFEVIEHLPYPVREWEQMTTIIRPGGLLYVTTPNYRSLGHSIVGSEWSIVNYPEHLNYFTPRTLEALSDSVGLRRKWLITTGIITKRLFSSRSSSPDRRKRADDSQEHLRTRIEGNIALRWMKAGINTVLNLLKIGDSMKAGFEKPVAESTQRNTRR